MNGCILHRLLLLWATCFVVCLNSHHNAGVDAHLTESSSSSVEDGSAKITSYLGQEFEGTTHTKYDHAFSYFGQIASFGNQMKYATVTHVDLHLPSNSNEPYLCDSQQHRNEDNNIQGVQSHDHDHYQNPIALLVKRGNCSFETKARNALYIQKHVNPRVQYIFVYNNDEYYRKEIFSMSAEEEDDHTNDSDLAGSTTSNNTLTDIDSGKNNKSKDLEELNVIGLIFVSTDTGSTLLDMIRHLSGVSKSSPYLTTSTNDAWCMPTYIETNGAPQMKPSHPGYVANKGSWAEHVYFLIFMILMIFVALAILSCCCCRFYQWNHQPSGITMMMLATSYYPFGGGTRRRTDTTISNNNNNNNNNNNSSDDDDNILNDLDPNDLESGLTHEERCQKRLDFIKSILKTKIFMYDDDGDEHTTSSSSIKGDTKDVVVSDVAQHRKGNSSRKDNKKEDQDDDETKEEDVCTICLREFKKGDILGHTLHPKCNHEFHVQCITYWLLKHKDCPLCRRNVCSDMNNTIDDESNDDDNGNANSSSRTSTTN